MTTDAKPSRYSSMPSTFGRRRVVELTDEFKVATADMLAICDRLGVVVEDASQWLTAETVDLIRGVVALNGPTAVLSDKSAAEPIAERPPEPPKAEKPAELGSVGRDGVRPRRVVLIGLLIALLAGASGILVERWADYVTNTEEPATVVTTGEG